LSIEPSAWEDWPEITSTPSIGIDAKKRKHKTPNLRADIDPPCVYLDLEPSTR
jgi:hypothetical protein